MSKPERPSSQDDLGKRIRDARAKREARKPKPKADGAGGSGLGVGLRMATEIVAAVLIGAGMGMVLDSWLGTKPWLMVLFLILGCGAAFVNVMRTANEMERRRKEDRDKARADNGDSAGSDVNERGL